MKPYKEGEMLLHSPSGTLVKFVRYENDAVAVVERGVKFPVFVSELQRRKAVGVGKEDCPNCGGSGVVWEEVIRSEHDPRCDGSCSVGCPIPIQDLEWDYCICVREGASGGAE